MALLDLRTGPPMAASALRNSWSRGPEGSQGFLDGASAPLNNPDPRTDPKSRSPNSGLYYSYGVDRWIYFLDPPRGLGSVWSTYHTIPRPPK